MSAPLQETVSAVSDESGRFLDQEPPEDGDGSPASAAELVEGALAVEQAEKPAAQFVRTLWTLLNAPESESLCRWSACGQHIVFPQAQQFGEQVCPRYFRHSKWSSFSRMLNMHGFKKVSVTPRHAANAAQTFEHPNFVRGEPGRLYLVVRKKRKKAGEAAAQSASDRQDLEFMRLRLAELEGRIQELELENSQLRSSQLAIGGDELLYDISHVTFESPPPEGYVIASPSPTAGGGRPSLQQHSSVVTADGDDMANHAPVARPAPAMPPPPVEAAPPAAYTLAGAAAQLKAMMPTFGGDRPDVGDPMSGSPSPAGASPYTRPASGFPSPDAALDPYAGQARAPVGLPAAAPMPGAPAPPQAAAPKTAATAFFEYAFGDASPKSPFDARGRVTSRAPIRKRRTG